MAGVCVNLVRFTSLIIIMFELVVCRKHNIELEGDTRTYFKISTFGILRQGQITIDIENLTFVDDKNIKLAFSVQKTSSAGVSTYTEGHTESCMLFKNNTGSNHLSFDMFILHWNKIKEVAVKKCGNINPIIDNKIVRKIHVPHSSEDREKKLTPTPPSDSTTTTSDPTTCSNLDPLPLNVTVTKDGKTSISAVIVIHVEDKREQGLYNVYFHHCNSRKPVSLKLTVVEINENGYLSAGEAPLPMVLGFFAVVFFILSCIWFYVLREYWIDTFKVHYLMFLLVLLKALDVSLNAINYYYIEKHGTRAESWAVLHYIAHLLKGGLLFTTIILLGTGYFFIKHVLSGRDKKIFLIIIPLQIFDNIALIIMESTEEAEAEYATWKQMFILVDLVCCGAVLFPVIWAIRHLKEASQTDGKAAVNLAKLKLFRQFYIMIVCYIYFTRIVVAIVKITVPFQYQWFEEFFMNLATLALFIMTGYKFRPGSDNPYLHVPQEDKEVEMDEVVTQCGLTENMARVQHSDEQNTTTTSRIKLSSA